MAKELCRTIKKDLSELASQVEYLEYNIGSIDKEYQRKRIKFFLQKYEKGYLRAKDLVRFAEPPQSAGNSKCDASAQLEVFSDDAYLFTLPPMRSFRKKEESSGLGNYMWQLVWDLLQDAKNSGPIKKLTRPTILFLHSISEEDQRKRLVPDPDNLDTSKVIDALHDSGLMYADSILDITLIQRGQVAAQSQTQVFVFSEGHENDFKNQGLDTNYL